MTLNRGLTNPGTREMVPNFARRRSSRYLEKSTRLILADESLNPQMFSMLLDQR